MQTYEIFSPLSVCRHAFKTRRLRFKLDTSVETGVNDWNCIDYIELFGATTQQPAAMAPGNTNAAVVYIPDQGEFRPIRRVNSLSALPRFSQGAARRLRPDRFIHQIAECFTH